MYKSVPTLTDFILQEERKIKNATGSFTILLTQIENAAKIINSHIRASGLADILGKTGTTNVYQEEVQKLDKFCNDLLVNTLSTSGQVYAIISEELEKPHMVKEYKGEYIVALDPLDGSSGIDSNSVLGTIFSIYHKKGGVLQQGKNQVAAGYIVYGASTMFVYTFGRDVNGFTLDPAIGSFLLSHENIRMPEYAKTYATNEGNSLEFDEELNSYLSKIKKEGYKLRYSGCLVAETHRIVMQGGIFLYPATSKLPSGKLRLLLEVNPIAFLVEQAGGVSYAVDSSPLSIAPKSISDRSPFCFGGKKNMEELI
ncbi:MAG: fructose-1,6-bisphosphatase [Candidatus Levybacteria bacterium]|nr:fructose-1,6-bisphosphatase [Candidatus Levybacteria bacterium]